MTDTKTLLSDDEIAAAYRTAAGQQLRELDRQHVLAVCRAVIDAHTDALLASVSDEVVCYVPVHPRQGLLVASAVPTPPEPHPLRYPTEAMVRASALAAARADLSAAHERIKELEDGLLWALYNHLGGSSPVGQPIRKILGIGRFDRLTLDQVARAEALAQGGGRGDA